MSDLASRRGAPHRDDLLVANILNGVTAEEAGRAFGIDGAVAAEIFESAMRRCEEYAVSHCLPLLRCRGVEAARRERTRVLDLIAQIRVWTDAERDVVLDILRGVDVVRKYEISREVATDVFARGLRALPHYLPMAEAAEIARDQVTWVRNPINRRKAMAAVERMVSFDNPFRYKNVQHQLITAS
jgi:hypothetical protein